jgi:hypothetical protein
VVAAILFPQSLYGGNRKTKLPLLHEVRYAPPKGTLGILVVAHRTDALRPHLASLRRKHCDPVAFPPLRSLSARPDPISALQAFGLGFVAQPKNLNIFVQNLHKPCRFGAASTPIPLMTWPPRRPGSTLVLRLNQEIVPDFVLLFLPPCDPHLISFGHRVHRVQPTCLSTSWRPHKLRAFTPALHLHQHKSCWNLHLQYSAKSQSTPHCQSLITPRSDHPPIIGRSGPHSPPR